MTHTATDPRRPRARPRAWTQHDYNEQVRREMEEERRQKQADEAEAYERREERFGPDPRSAVDGAGNAAAVPPRGLVLGRFDPPHLGHQYLFDYARAYCQGRVLVLVRGYGLGSAPVESRVEWVREMCPPPAEVLPFPYAWPKVEPDHPAYWEEWARIIGSAFGGRACHLVFGSDDTARRVAIELGTRYVAVDPQRRVVPVSATDIRKDVLGKWRFLATPARPHFVRRVCLLGPEGAGKSTLAERLAECYGTVFVPDQARLIAEEAGGKLDELGLSRAAAAQASAESALARQANRVMFCDGSLYSLSRWSRRLFGHSPRWINVESPRQTYHLYLLAGADSPGAPPAGSEAAAAREAFERACADRDYSARSAPLVTLNGDWQARFERACAAVDKLLAERVTAGDQDEPAGARPW